MGIRLGLDLLGALRGVPCECEAPLTMEHASLRVAMGLRGSCATTRWPASTTMLRGVPAWTATSPLTVGGSALRPSRGMQRVRLLGVRRVVRLRPVLLALPFGRVAVGAVCAAAVAVLGTVPRIPTGAGAGPLTRAVEVSRDRQHVLPLRRGEGLSA